MIHAVLLFPGKSGSGLSGKSGSELSWMSQLVALESIFYCMLLD